MNANKTVRMAKSESTIQYTRPRYFVYLCLCTKQSFMLGFIMKIIPNIEWTMNEWGKKESCEFSSTEIIITKKE